MEQLLREASAPEELCRILNTAYGARGAYVHAAESKEQIQDLANKTEALLVIALTHRIKSAKLGVLRQDSAETY